MTKMVALTADWGLRILPDKTIELIRIFDGYMFAMELGTCTVPDDPGIQEGINFLRSGGITLFLPS